MSSETLEKLITLLLIGTTLLGSLGSVHWRFDLVSHFRIQYLIISILLLLRFGVHKKLLQSFFVGCVFLFNFAYVLPYSGFTSTAQKTSITTNRLKIVHYNLFNLNKRYDDVFLFIENTSPDFISLQEMNSGWRKTFHRSKVSKLYPYQLINTKTQTAFLSRIPPKALVVLPKKPNTGYLDSAIKAVFQVKKQPLTIIVGHTYTPVTESNFEKQGNYYKWLAQLAKQTEDEAVMIIGDLNTTPWSSNFKFLKTGNTLKDASEFVGPHPTWPIFFPIALIPLDHVLVNREVSIINHQLGPFLGSDHLPLITEFSLK